MRRFRASNNGIGVRAPRLGPIARAVQPALGYTVHHAIFWQATTPVRLVGCLATVGGLTTFLAIAAPDSGRTDTPKHRLRVLPETLRSLFWA